MKSLVLSVFCLVLSLASVAAMADNVAVLSCHGIHEETGVRIEKNSDYQEARPRSGFAGRGRISFGYDVAIIKALPRGLQRVMKYKLKATGSLAADGTGSIELYPFNVEANGTGTLPDRQSAGTLTVGSCELDGQCDGLRGVLAEVGLHGVEMLCNPVN